jgi:ribonucleotide reductase alpha subunit
MDGIFDCQKNLANTFKYRGGSGFDITILRPKHSTVNNAANTSSGAVSFLPSFSEVGKVVGTNGRRSAMICTMDVRHPDIIDFIWCKADPGRVFPKDVFTSNLPEISSMNISLKITDSFMKAVENDEDWIFCFPDFEEQKDLYDRLWDGDYDNWLKEGGKFKEYGKVRAKDLLAQISEAAHLCGDPGLLYIDTAQRNTLGTYIDDSLKPVSSNPCGRVCRTQ